jgi:hypothetical protein
MAISKTGERTGLAHWLDRVLDWIESGYQDRAALSVADRTLADIARSRADLERHLTEAKEITAGQPPSCGA